MSSLLSRTDVAIVGAGVAGLAVARGLSGHGLSVQLLEAQTRLGGRLFTVREAGWTLPVELGAEFVHGAPSPLTALSKKNGNFQLIRLADHHHQKTAGGFTRTDDWWGRLARMLSSAIDAPGDESAQAFLDRRWPRSEDQAFARLLIESFHAAPLEDVSVKSLAEDAEGTESEFPQYRVAGGYDSVLRELEAGLEKSEVQVRLGASVRSIRWKPKSVQLTLLHEGHARVVEASRCVVTVPVVLLQAPVSEGSIEFFPPLDARREALAQLAMGQVVKLVLRFRRDPFGGRVPEDSEFFHDLDSLFPTFWRESTADQHQVTAWSGGPKAIALASVPPDELAERALVSMGKLLECSPAALREDLIKVHFHDFASDPYARGAYSYARPGPLEPREVQEILSAPVEQTLFFAGEALDTDHSGTIAGALGSGEHAARQVLAACSARHS